MISIAKVSGKIAGMTLSDFAQGLDSEKGSVGFRWSLPHSH